MARFFVGQRVRLVHHIDYGNTGVIVGFNGDGAYSVEVVFDNAGPVIDGGMSPAGAICDCMPEYLEPIIPGHESVAIAALLSEFPSLSNAIGVVA